MKRKLSTLKIGDSGFIDSFTDEELSLKFLEMGCLPGEEVFLERIAPLGDPIAIKVGDSALCLRKDEASGITVQMMNKG